MSAFKATEPAGVVSIVAASTFIHQLTYYSPWVRGQEYRRALIHCVEQLKANKPPPAIQQPDPDAYVSRMHDAAVALNACRASAETEKVLWLGACIAVLLVFAGLVYWLMPYWRIRSLRLQRLTPADDSRLWNALDSMVRECGIRTAPVFYVDPYDRSATGAVAFGRLGSPYIKLGAGLMTRFYVDRAAFRAIVLHELAHLRNVDVDKSYFSVALVLAFGVLGLVPLALSFALHADRAWFDYFWRSAGLVGFVALTGAAVLRTRELHADARVRDWGSAEPLSQVLQSMPIAKGWRRLLHVHPSPAERLVSLADAASLFRVGFWEAFGAGFATVVVYGNSKLLADALLAGTGYGGDAPQLLALVVMPLAICIVGLGVWRALKASLVNRIAVANLKKPALGLTLGLIVGEPLSYYAATGVGGSGFSVATPFWFLVLFVTVYASLRWIASTARVCVEGSASTGRRQVVMCIVGLGGMGLAFSFFFGWENAVRGMLKREAEFSWLLAGPMAHAWLLRAPVSLLLLFVWGLPLAARVILGWSVPAHGNALEARLGRHAWVDLRTALRAAVIGGGLYTIALLAARIVLLAKLGSEAFASRDFNMLFSVWRIGAAIAAGAAIASFVARRANTLPVIHGLAAAHLASIVMVGGWLGTGYMTLGKSAATDLAYAWWIYTCIAHWGALLAAIAARAAVRRTRDTAPALS